MRLATSYTLYIAIHATNQPSAYIRSGQITLFAPDHGIKGDDRSGSHVVQTALGTPPDSQDPSSRLLTSNETHQFKVAKSIVVTSHNTSTSTLSEDHTPHTSSAPLTIEHLEKLIAKLTQTKSNSQGSASNGTKSDTPGDTQPKGARASTLE